MNGHSFYTILFTFLTSFYFSHLDRLVSYLYRIVALGIAHSQANTAEIK